MLPCRVALRLSGILTPTNIHPGFNQTAKQHFGKVTIFP